MRSSDDLTLPVNLIAAAAREGRLEWLTTLPGTIEHLETLWFFQAGEPFQPGGSTAWVAPVTRAGEDLVVKVLWRHPEAEQEADALRVWRGDGAVRLHGEEKVDAETVALLLERCRPGVTLEAQPEPEQDLVVARLLRRLWRQPSVGHRSNTCSTPAAACTPTLMAWFDAWPIWPGSTPTAFCCGCLLAASRSRLGGRCSPR